ncbi:MAG: hypothetical protein AAGI90_02140 [Chlamydiota bacterium]
MNKQNQDGIHMTNTIGKSKRTTFGEMATGIDGHLVTQSSKESPSKKTHAKVKEVAKSIFTEEAKNFRGTREIAIQVVVHPVNTHNTTRVQGIMPTNRRRTNMPNPVRGGVRTSIGQGVPHPQQLSESKVFSFRRVEGKHTEEKG